MVERSVVIPLKSTTEHGKLPAAGKNIRTVWHRAARPAVGRRHRCINAEIAVKGQTEAVTRLWAMDWTAFYATADIDTESVP